MFNSSDEDRKYLLNTIRAGFTRQDSSLSRWCNEEGHHRQNVVKAILGQWVGPKTEILKTAAISAATGEKA
jgi:hypothetical protein